MDYQRHTGIVGWKLSLQHAHGCHFLALKTCAYFFPVISFVISEVVAGSAAWLGRGLSCVCAQRRDFEDQPSFELTPAQVIFCLVRVFSSISFSVGFVLLLIPITAVSVNHSQADTPAYILSCLWSTFTDYFTLNPSWMMPYSNQYSEPWMSKECG